MVPFQIIFINLKHVNCKGLLHEKQRNSLIFATIRNIIKSHTENQYIYNQ